MLKSGAHDANIVLLWRRRDVQRVGCFLTGLVFAVVPMLVKGSRNSGRGFGTFCMHAQDWPGCGALRKTQPKFTKEMTMEPLHVLEITPWSCEFFWKTEITVTTSIGHIRKIGTYLQIQGLTVASWFPKSDKNHLLTTGPSGLHFEVSSRHISQEKITHWQTNDK